MDENEISKEKKHIISECFFIESENDLFDGTKRYRGRYLPFARSRHKMIPPTTMLCTIYRTNMARKRIFPTIR